MSVRTDRSRLLRRTVDGLGTIDLLRGTAVDEAPHLTTAVDDDGVRPRSVLTPVVRLTCDDAGHPQFPHPLRRRRIPLGGGPIIIMAGDERRAA